MDDVIEGATVLARLPGTLWRRLLNGVLVFTASMDEPLRLSQPADVLWQLLEEPRRFDDLVDMLAALYGVAPAVIGSDLQPVLRVLLDGGAVVETPG